MLNSAIPEPPNALELTDTRQRNTSSRRDLTGPFAAAEDPPGFAIGMLGAQCRFHRPKGYPLDHIQGLARENLNTGGNLGYFKQSFSTILDRKDLFPRVGRG